MSELAETQRRSWRLLPRSLQWQLQAWQAFLSTCMLVAFGVTAYNMVTARRFIQVDAELQARVSALRRSISGARRREKPPDLDRNPRSAPPLQSLRALGRPRPPGRPSGPPPEFFGPPPGPPPIPGHLPKNFTIPPETADLFGLQAGFYFEILSPDAAILLHSENAPADSPQPTFAERDLLSHFRTWASYRELIHCSGAGDCVIVGRSVADELRNATAMAWLFPLAGSAVLLIGLIVGWWIIHRSVQPIKQIEATAEEIRRGKLSARVPVCDPDNELGRLSATLNTTFARLETTFERQKQFTSDAAHELRTPLAVMITEAQTTLARPRGRSGYKDSLESCLEAAQEMRKLTDTLLDLARLDIDNANAQPTEFDLADVVLRCIQQLQPVASKQAITLKHDLSPVRVVNVAERMALVVTNLISNAITYNHPGGEVLVRTWSGGTHIGLSVADTGIGIGPVDLPRIFDRFYRTDKVRSRAGGHAGLGLSICKAILEVEDGTIHVQSELGKGTVFTVRLPAGSQGRC